MAVGAFSLTDKIVLDTGGGSGIGLSFTQLAIKQGARVIADLNLTSQAEDFVKTQSTSTVVLAKYDVTNVPI